MKRTTILINILFSLSGYAQTLSEYVALAKRNNSGIEIARAAYELEKERINEVADYANTNFSFGAFALTPETRVGSQLFKVGVSQKLPWFGAFTAKRNIVTALAKVKKYDIDLVDRDLVLQVRKAYYELYQQERITSVFKENKQILKIYEKIALAALSNNRATMSDVLRIRVQKNNLQSKILQNTNNLEVMQRNFNRLLQREIEAKVPVSDTLMLSDIVLDGMKITAHPSITKIQKMQDYYDAKEEIIAIDEKPKLSVGLDYIWVAKRNNVTIPQNGKDVLMPKVGLSIPLFAKKYSSQYKQITIQKEATEYAVEDKKLQLEYSLEAAILTVKNAILSIKTARRNNEDIQRAIDVDLKAYETTILDYDKVLRLQLQKIQFQLQEIEALKKAFIAYAKVRYLTK